MGENAMRHLVNLDLRAYAELLSYLVMSQLHSRSTSGEWLTLPNLVATERIWLEANGGISTSITIISIASWSQSVAETLSAEDPIAMGTDTIAMFSGDPRLDFGIRLVRTVYNRCQNHLMEMGWFMGGKMRYRHDG
jgi:hypothetical protein